MRTLAPSVLTLALFAHLGWVGVPSLCVPESSAAPATVEHGQAPGRLSAVASLDVLAAEPTSGEAEPTGAGATRATEAPPEASGLTITPTPGCRACPTRVVPSSLLAYMGHPATAPPRRI